jgi:hypothetical protein
MNRQIYEIANEIISDWQNPSPHAIPYIRALKQLTDMNSQFGSESAASVILYFLSNASSWKGEVARRIKSELNLMCKQHYKRNESKQIKIILSLLEATLYKENLSQNNTLIIDTSIKKKNSKGQTIYGSDSESGVQYNAAERHFSCYIHALSNAPGNVIQIKDKQSGRVLSFMLTKVDKDASDEDIYGWNYECNSPKGKLTLLIIND